MRKKKNERLRERVNEKIEGMRKRIRKKMRGYKDMTDPRKDERRKAWR